MKKSALLVLGYLALITASKAQLNDIYSNWKTVNFYVGWHVFSENTATSTNEYPQGINETIGGWSIWQEIASYDAELFGLPCRWEYKNELIENLIMWGAGKVLKAQPGGFQEFGGDIGSVYGAAAGMGHFGVNVIDNGNMIYAVGPSLGDFAVSHLASEQSAIGRYHFGAGVFNQIDYALDSKTGVRGTLVLNKALHSFEISADSNKPWLMLTGVECFRGRWFVRAELLKPISSDQVNHSALRLKVGFR
ncbi:MAG: hypothetical protein JXQ90_06145 [Cyclobacteriaceae bacterium]